MAQVKHRSGAAFMNVSHRNPTTWITSDARLQILNSPRWTDIDTRYLTSQLPAHMIPSTFSLLRTLPRTANGKVDRTSLMSEGGKGELATARIIAPRNDVEKRLLIIWQRIFKTDNQDVTQDFFAMGGH